MYLIVAKYSDDAERKRIDYLFEKWKERIKITKPEGMVVLLDGVEERGLAEILEDLLSRVKEDKITLYKLEHVTTQIEKNEKELRASISGDEKTIGRLLNFLLARYKGVLKRESPQPREKVYEVYTRKGMAEVSLRLKESPGKVDIRVRIAGYGEVVDLLHNKLGEEMKYLEEA